MVFLFVLITFEPILEVFLRFWTNPEIQDGGPRWPPFKNDYPIITSCDVISSYVDVKGDIFRHTNFPPSLAVIAFIFSELRGRGGGGRSPPPLPVVEDQKSPV